MQDSFIRQAELVLHILPIIDREEVFAIKGGTAINFFVRNMPRLSVDVDLVYLPITQRGEALKGIRHSLQSIGQRIRRMFPATEVQERRLKLIIRQGEATVKIEPNQVLRGSVYPVETKDLVKEAQKVFEMYVSVRSLCTAELYGGKICAALDRQHPRDFFDFKVLLDNEGLTEKIRKAFVVYLVSHNRPMSELLEPHFLDMRHVFETDFAGIARIPYTYEELVQSAEKLVKLIRTSLTEDERRFIVSIQKGSPDWDMLGMKDVDELPAVKWKLLNIGKMSSSKKTQEVKRLRECLEISP